MERIDDFDARSRDCCGNDSGCEGKHSCGVRVRSFIHVDWNVCDSRARQAILSDRQRDAAQLAVTCGSENNFCTNYELDVRHVFSEATQACLRRNFANRDRRYAASRICNLHVAVPVFPDAARDRNWEYFVVSMAPGLGIGYFVGRCLLLRDDVTSAVARDDYAEEAFVIETVADKKRGHISLVSAMMRVMTPM